MFRIMELRIFLVVLVVVGRGKSPWEWSLVGVGGTVGVGVVVVPKFSSPFSRVVGRLFVLDGPGTKTLPRGTSREPYLYKYLILLYLLIS